MLFHVNTKTGKASKCSATQGKCPFGNVSEHFTSVEAARSSFEKTQEIFTPKKKLDLLTSMPEWHGKLPAIVEAKIAKKINEDLQFLDDVESGVIETKYNHPEAFLSPPIYAIRDRGTFFVNEHDNDDELVTVPEGEYLIAIHARQGAGNRECYCDDDSNHDGGCLSENNDAMADHPQYFQDHDNEYDATYSTFYFRAGTTKADIEKYDEQRTLKSKANHISVLKGSITSGQVTPWSILVTDHASIDAYSGAKSKLAGLAKSIASSKANVITADAGLDAIAKGSKLTEAESDQVAFAAGYSRYQVKSFTTDLQGLRTNETNLLQAKARFTQAEALPDGELKDYLLGDRGTSSYQSPVTKGRRKSYVTKTYQRGTLLGKELDDNQNRNNQAVKSMQSRVDKLKEFRKLNNDNVETFDTLNNQLNGLRVKAWSSGWPGLFRDIPAIPESF